MERSSHPAPPGPPDLLSPLRLVRYLGANPLEYYRSLWRQYGSLVRWKMGPRIFYLVSEPQQIRHVLVENVENYIRGESYRKLKRMLGNGLLTNDGEAWKATRDELHGLFTPKAVHAFDDAVARHSAELLTKWSALGEKNQTLDIAQTCQRFMIGLTGDLLFGQDWSADTEQIRENLNCITVHCFDAKNLFVPERLPIGRNRAYIAARRWMWDYLDRVIERGLADTNQETVLSLLIAMHAQGRLSDENLKEELLTFLAAGADTTAQGITWTLHLLTTHPEYAEQIAKAPPSEGPIGAVLEEALRLYPPVWGLARWAREDDVIDGHSIEGGSMVILAQYLANHDPARWENPECFQPERFLDPPVDSPRGSSFAFGAGPHTCIGQHLAMKVLNHLIPRICGAFQLHAHSPQPIKPYPGFTLYPQNGIQVAIHKRTT